jgi:hypothetical protein
VPTADQPGVRCLKREDVNKYMAHFYIKLVFVITADWDWAVMSPFLYQTGFL